MSKESWNYLSSFYKGPNKKLVKYDTIKADKDFDKKKFSELLTSSDLKHSAVIKSFKRNQSKGLSIEHSGAGSTRNDQIKSMKSSTKGPLKLFNKRMMTSKFNNTISRYEKHGI